MTMTATDTTAVQASEPNEYGYRGFTIGSFTFSRNEFFANIDAAATSVGFPIRNMHTISETGHTGDVLAAVYGIHALLERFERERVTADTLRNTHPRLDVASPLRHTAG